MAHPRGRPPAIRAAADARPARRPGFSLVELVIVVIILGIVASIALRRVSRHAEAGAASAAQQDVAVLQQAVERYRAEHGTYPAADQVADQLTWYTDVFGAVSKARGTPYIYGPYVRRVPPVPLGPARGSTTIAATAGEGIGWIYDETTGEIKPNQ